MENKPADASNHNQSHGQNGNSSHEHQQQKKEKSRNRRPPASLVSMPLDKIVMSCPKLFVTPAHWTRKHTTILRVVYKETLLMNEFYGNEINLFRDPWHSLSRRDPDSSESTGPPRVPTFRLPALSSEALNSHINQLRSNDANSSYAMKKMAMDNLLLRPTVKIGGFNIVDYGSESSPQPLGDESITNSEDKLCRLSARAVTLSLKYGKRQTPLFFNVRGYDLDTDTNYDRRNLWRLYYLDRSQLGIRPWKKQKRRRNMAAKKAGKDGAEDAPASNRQHNGGGRRAFRLTQGALAGIFLSMAQTRERELEFCSFLKSLDSPISMRQEPEPQPQQQQQQQQPARYQLLYTDNGEDDTYIHLYTAQISDILLKHFDTPARIPPTELSIPCYMRIHRVAIPYAPFKTFRKRLCTAIQENANKTLNGFFNEVSYPIPSNCGNEAASVQQKESRVKTSEQPAPNHEDIGKGESEFGGARKEQPTNAEALDIEAPSIPALKIPDNAGERQQDVLGAAS